MVNVRWNHIVIWYHMNIGITKFGNKTSHLLYPFFQWFRLYILFIKSCDTLNSLIVRWLSITGSFSNSILIYTEELYDQQGNKCKSKLKEYLGLLSIHNFILNQITFVSNEKLAYTVICISINFTQPLLDIVEALHFSNIIHNLKRYWEYVLKC